MKKQCSLPSNSQTSLEKKKKQIKEFKLCQADPAYFINNYCKIINVKKEGEKIFPFKLWPHQVELLNEIKQFNDIFVEKSRELGISWFVMAFELHQALFTNYFTALNISRKESEVEDTGKTFHSLMGRIDFMYQRLPEWLKFQIRNPKLSFQVYHTHSIIKGESANKDAGRDTQYKMIFVDEAAHIDVFPEMWKGIRNSTDCLVINSL